MARVSQEHLDARRSQILDGAARCFARNGFHATSMQDVLQEAGLSAGAVYRYFRGKDEIIEAVVTTVIHSFRDNFAAAAVWESTPPPLDELLGRLMRGVLGLNAEATDESNSFPPLIVQVWAETLRNKELNALMREGFSGMRASWVKIFEAYQAEGLMRDDIPAESVARTMLALTQGFGVQVALFGEAPVEEIEAGVRALTSMGARR
ncbi:TetR/AcrR family transcriptional regulator [Streptomyces sp. NPDC050738]|uniref:TetR/AcrR family transcriptional regulator n=1 Tax=Streptomyces sp. NPDC050738 TaxID=3154744 RepID=UPI00341E7EB6